MPRSDETQPSRRPSSDAPASRRSPSRRENAARLDKVFGQVLPDTTSDEREPSWHEAGGASDDWYLENRPPHH
ncbi:MAG: hypothetical protein GEU97_02745 [Actinophytocola sp.]|nr:hypothetical protein [Actinophytocola sp.]